MRMEAAHERDFAATVHRPAWKTRTVSWPRMTSASVSRSLARETRSPRRIRRRRGRLSCLGRDKARGLLASRTADSTGPPDRPPGLGRATAGEPDTSNGRHLDRYAGANENFVLVVLCPHATFSPR